MSARMKCGLCGYEFEPADAQSSCAACPLVPDCHLLRCPRCGYEMPPEAKLVTLLRKLRERRRAPAPVAVNTQPVDRAAAGATARERVNDVAKETLT
jgi:rubredoxin